MSDEGFWILDLQAHGSLTQIFSTCRGLSVVSEHAVFVKSLGGLFIHCTSKLSFFLIDTVRLTSNQEPVIGRSISRHWAKKLFIKTYTFTSPPSGLVNQLYIAAMVMGS